MYTSWRPYAINSPQTNVAEPFEPLYGDADFHRERPLTLSLESSRSSTSREAVPAVAS
jgi:hypothetical protein